RDAEAREAATCLRDLGVRLRIEPLAGLDPRLQQAELLQLARERGLDPGALAELVEIELRLLLGQTHPPRPTLPPRARGQLLGDPAQGQELVAVQRQDRLEPLHVVLVEQPVAALGAAWPDEALVLEVADLRDRDVRELRLQPPADRSDREELVAR